MFAGIVQAHIRRYFVEHFQGSGLTFHGKSREQQIIADGVDQSGDSLGPKLNLFQQLVGNNRLLGKTGAGHP